MRHRPPLTTTIRLILPALRQGHQPLSCARLAELTGTASSTVLLSLHKLHNNGIIATGNIDGITHHEVSHDTPSALTAVSQ